MISIVLFGLVLGVIDLARAGFVQHNLDSGTNDLARSLVAVSNLNTSTLPAFTPTALTPANAQAALAHAAGIANGAFSASALTATGDITLSNGQVTVVGTPNLTSPNEIGVTVTAPFTPAVGIFLRGKVFHLQSTSSALTRLGQQ